MGSEAKALLGRTRQSLDFGTMGRRYETLDKILPPNGTEPWRNVNTEPSLLTRSAHGSFFVAIIGSCI